MRNLFDIDNFAPDMEHFETIFEALPALGCVKLERIVSFGHPTATDEWYDQTQTEWVALLRGEATLLYADGSKRRMTIGDNLIIEPHVKHRVEHVSDDAVWLALFVE